jgi:hypothetical protein
METSKRSNALFNHKVLSEKLELSGIMPCDACVALGFAFRVSLRNLSRRAKEAGLSAIHSFRKNSFPSAAKGQPSADVPTEARTDESRRRKNARRTRCRS